MDINEIQSALRDADLDGWLFYDFRGSDEIALSMLGISPRRMLTRRWYYYLPAVGEPVRIVHAIEDSALDGLPGQKRTYLAWRQREQVLGELLTGSRRIAMQYSPRNTIPYVSRVDAGTVELIRSFGVEVVSSADLIQRFEATIDDEQWQTHVRAADLLAQLVAEVFAEIARCLKSGIAATEHSIQAFMLAYYEQHGLKSDNAPIVAIGPHAADPHFEPAATGSREFAPEQLVLIDTWAKLRDHPRAIYADITWMGYTGSRVPAEYADVFSVVRAARDAALDAVVTAQANGRPIRGCDVDDVCRGVIVAKGYGDYFIHRTGHSIHQTDHGNGANIDNLETSDTRLLIPRTLFSIEPGIYLPGRFGIRSEIDVFLPDAHQALVSGSPPQKEIIPIQ